jgi:hypothetical protein
VADRGAVTRIGKTVTASERRKQKRPARRLDDVPSESFTAKRRYRKWSRAKKLEILREVMDAQNNGRWGDITRILESHEATRSHLRQWREQLAIGGYQ